MTEVPAETPVTTPEELTVARVGVTLLQVPPAMLLARVVVPPVQIEVAPLTTPAYELTVTVYVAATGAQPLVFV